MDTSALNTMQKYFNEKVQRPVGRVLQILSSIKPECV
jgi:hypothetical protein